MLAQLIPDPAQLAVLGASFVVAALSVGLGGWAGARRIEVALLAGWGITALATVAVGTLSGLSLVPVMALAGLAGAGGLLRIAVTRGAGLEAAPFLRVLLLALPLFAVTASLQTAAWDDFSHWLPNLAYLCAHGHFPTLAQPSGSYHAAYPTGLALPGFAVWTLFGLDPDNVALVWNQIMILAAAASVAHVLRRHVAAPWTCAALGLLFTGLAAPSFVAKIVFSNMADSATGAVLAVLLSLLAEWVARPADRTRLAIGFALGCVVLLNLRQANGALYGLLLLGAVLAGLRNPAAMRAGSGFALVVSILLPGVATVLWSRYAHAQIPGGEFSFLPLASWRWDALGQITGSMVHVMLSKIGLFGLILVLVLRAVFAFRPSDTLQPWQRASLIAGAFTAVGMIGFLGLTYLAADFNEQEARAAASFWRYMGETGPIAVVAAAAVLPLPSRRLLPPQAVAVLVLVTLAAPLAGVRMLRDDLQSPVPTLRRIGQALVRDVPPSAPLALVDLTGNGFALLIADYDLSLSVPAMEGPPRAVRRVSSITGLTPAEAAKLDLSHDTYVWLAEGTAQAGTLFGVPMGRDCSYLLRHDAAGYTVLDRWPIGRFKWITFPNGWSAAKDPACG